MPKSREEIRHEGQHKAPWISPHYGDGGWHTTPGTVRYTTEWEPFSDHILVELDPEPEGIIARPDCAAKERNTRIGTVLKVGPGKRNKEGRRVPLTLKSGDRVIVGHYSDWESWDADWEGRGRNVAIFQEADVRLIVTDN